MKSVKVAQCNTNGVILAVYPSISAAAAAMGCRDTSMTNIRNALHGLQPTAYGYKWRTYYTRGRVDQFDMDGQYVATYESIADAARLTGVAYKNIWRALKGATANNSSSGYVWKMAGEGSEKKPKQREVIGVNVATGEAVRFRSINDAARTVTGNNGAASRICYTLAHGHGRGTAYNYRWRYAEDD